VTALERLREVALDQHGLVTTAQALDVGVRHASLSMMVRRGRLERVAYGVYRVPQVPVTPQVPYMEAVLWTGVAEACLSHETALDVYAISDINPTRLHVTVSRSRRLRRAGGERYVVHYEDLAPSQIGWWEQVPTVTPTVAVEQCIRYGTPTYLLRQALERGPRDGKLRADDAARLTHLLEHRDDRP